MVKGQSLYRVMVVVTAVFIAYVLYANFIHDPEASRFLGHKTDMKRPINVPVWLNVMTVHVAFACVAMVSGAVNFSKHVIADYRKLHRINGYVYLVAVLAVVLTSGYMAPYTTGGKLNSIAFNMLNIIWPAMTITAIVQIKKKRLDRHRKWMIRSYAFCFTNLFIHLITFLFHNGLGFEYAASYTIGVYGTIVLLFLLAELVIRAFPMKSLLKR
ncbi:DUF2306 domain-containing protein [Paenibacillus ginsengarvi]|uniref:DUF2306 domain-containing protein n=1 Tax=Paenibacillus ginsengarvi TaxID=400777 RepID=A0A3B0C0G6_9BACL|nr:DUF2306 domain-containing protein [Paenibacillus ginsengarvi]RKN77116.1 DUF2306 domain-containing protein [Paenibacillus ginsengarvi]